MDREWIFFFASLVSTEKCRKHKCRNEQSNNEIGVGVGLSPCSMSNSEESRKKNGSETPQAVRNGTDPDKSFASVLLQLAHFMKRCRTARCTLYPSHSRPVRFFDIFGIQRNFCFRHFLVEPFFLGHRNKHFNQIMVKLHTCRAISMILNLIYRWWLQTNTRIRFCIVFFGKHLVWIMCPFPTAFAFIFNIIIITTLNYFLWRMLRDKCVHRAK